MNVNGALTLGENIGDLGGWRSPTTPTGSLSLGAGGEAPVIDGFTGDQRFFLCLGAAVARGQATGRGAATAVVRPAQPE